MYHTKAAQSMYNSGSAKQPCQTIEELANSIRADIEASGQSSVPECTTSELSLSLSAWVPLHRPNIGPYAEGGEHDLPAEFKTSWSASGKAGKDGKKLHPQASVHSIIFAPDQHARQTVQRAASRGIVAAIEAVDGFKYAFNNAWASKDEDGLRFSYICQDSTQNKDRHANGFTRTTKHLKGEGERGPRKPTYDCKGSISVKCSLQKECLDVFYRHYAIHPKVAERKSASNYVRRPRQIHDPPEAAPARDLRSEDTGGLAGRLQSEDTAFMPPPKPPVMVEVNTQQVSSIGRPLKRKRDNDGPVQSIDPNPGLSLAQLLKQSASAKPTTKPTPSKTTVKANMNAPQPPITYDLPSWQQPPPGPVQTPTPNARPQQSSQQAANLPPSYQPPYQPPPQTPQPPQHTRYTLTVGRQTPVTYPPPSQQPPPPPPQQYLGLPKGHPKSQGLFTTMKPVAKDPPPPPGYMAMALPQQARTKVPCTNCKFDKKKCDELRPYCGPCLRNHRYDCYYEGSYENQYSYGPAQSPWPAQPAPMAPMQMQQQTTAQRPASPDPWFPKR